MVVLNPQIFLDSLTWLVLLFFFKGLTQEVEPYPLSAPRPQSHIYVIIPKLTTPENFEECY